ncbi:MAG: NAD(P)-dependent oxidoreductase [Proteobacteria bacterium]|nr:NAD(P)-dependent oxidoreductase [Pseudomonadota bacterium]
MAKSRVGMIGLGIMGSAMAANLVKGGFEVIGYDPVAACRARLKRSGGVPAGSALEVARSADVLITSLPSAKVLAQVAAEIAGVKNRRQVVIETSTLPIPDKEAARRRLAKSGSTLLDCPLSGTGAQARTKDLVVYASGPTAAIKRCVPVFGGFARGHYDLGRFGNGSKMKFAANLLVAIHNVSAAEAVILARKSGIDAALAVKVLGDGAGSSRMLQVRGPMMAKRSYKDATMKVEVWQKDMKIIGEFLRELGSPAPLFQATKSIYNAAMMQGLATADTAAVCAVLEARARKRRR